MGVKRIWIGLAALAVVAFLVIGLLQANEDGSDKPKSAATSSAKVRAELAGAPAPLAKLHGEDSQLLGGGPAAFKARLAELKGHPVVVNKWASWCGPCRAEFPVFQRASTQLGRRVAFLGVDSNDSDGDARDFLRRYPVSYPSYADPDQKVAQVFGATLAFPTTAFYRASGKLAYVHQGPYLTAAKLREDVARYAL
jgi:cytochrome c biogenesis protein CcmG, thiol:disulfide interchange protein DsbE